VPVRFQDYYEVLGVPRSASAQELQRAFRKLARENHPDVNKAPGAEARFKQVTEAYEVLRDPEKRKKYDALGEHWRMGQEFTPPGGGGAQGPFGASGFEGFGGASGFSDFFEAFFGGGGLGQRAGRGRRGARARAMRPEHDERELELSLEEFVSGEPIEFALQTSNGTRRISLRIPPGIGEGGLVRLAKQGEPGPDGQASDLHLRVRLRPHASWKVEGADLRGTLVLTPWEAALGAQVPLRTLRGELLVRVPPGSSSGARLRLREQGLPRAEGGRGDLLLELSIAVPKSLSERERELFESLSQASSFRPRA